MRARLLLAVDRDRSAVSGRPHRGGGTLLAGVTAVAAVVVELVAFGVGGHHTGTSNPASPASVDRSRGIPAKPVSLYAAGVVDVGGGGGAAGAR